MPFPRLAPVTPIVDPGDRVVWRARWIQNLPFFMETERGSRPCDRSLEDASRLRNVHSFYRREVTLPAKPCRAILRVTADDTCRLYLNGALAAFGPAQSYPCHYFYGIYDVTDAIDAGRLAIAAHVYYFGMRGHSYISGDNLEGLFLQLDLVYPDGSTGRVVTDAHWRVLTCGAWGESEPYGYTTQFAEHIDVASIPTGWREPGFDDSAWPKAPVRGTPYPLSYHLVPQPTPPLALVPLSPVSVRALAPGRWLLDFGREIVGCTQLLVHGESGAALEVRHAEELNADGTARCHLRANCVYCDTVTLTGRDDCVELFDPKGFRYVELLGYPGTPDTANVRVLSTSYPYDECAEMTCSDPLLPKVWDICANAVHWGTQDTFYDCPTREKGGFLGDAYITAFAHLYLTGDPRVTRKVLFDFAHSLRMDAGMTDVAPSYVTGGLVDYTMLYPSFVERYYAQTGDFETVRALLYVIDALREVADGWENAEGLIAAPSSPIAPAVELTLIDWPPNLRLGVDFEGASANASAVINGNYYGFCKSAAVLYTLCGEQSDAAACRAKADSVAKAMETCLYVPNRRLFADHDKTANVTLHANAPALCFGVPFPGGTDAAVSLLSERGLMCGVYFAYYVLRGLYNAGAYDAAWALLAGHGEYSWNAMLESGATACLEVWKPDMKWNTSFCHPWASSPIVLWIEEVCGLTPAAPGWEALSFAPRTPHVLAHGSVTIPTPRGNVAVSFVRADAAVVYTLTLDVETPVHCSFPDSAVDAALDGVPLPLAASVERLGVPVRTASVTINAGTHRFTVTGV